MGAKRRRSGAAAKAKAALAPVRGERTSRRFAHEAAASSPVLRWFASATRWSGALHKIEWAVLGIACLLVLGLHVVLYQHMGAFWRDETSTIQVAQQPTLRAMWDWLDADSCPVLAPSLVRFWIGLGIGGTDLGLRLLGALVSLGFIAAVFVCCRRIVGTGSFTARESGGVIPRDTQVSPDKTPPVAAASPSPGAGEEPGGAPVLAIALAAFNTSIFYYGSSIRAYGLACTLIVLCFAVFWKLVQQPSLRTSAIALSVAMLSVHGNYQNAYLLLGIGLAAALTCTACGLWKRSVLVLGLCGVTALSMLVYLPTIEAYRVATSIVFQELNMKVIGGTVLKSIAGPSAALLGVWMLLLLLLAVLLPVQCGRQWRLGAGRSTPSLHLYCLLAAAISGVAGFVFVRFNSMPPWLWHFTPFIALAAVIIEVGLRPSRNSFWLASSRLVVACVVIAVSVGPLWTIAHRRRTNIDLVSQFLTREAGPDDLIVVNPMWLSPAFKYHYHGGTPWITLPEMPADEKSRVSCYRPFRELMMTPDALRPTLRRIETTLAAGNRLWIVGELTFWQMSRIEPPMVTAAPDPQAGWSAQKYYEAWTMQTSRFLGGHIRHAERINVPLNQPVDPVEDYGVVVRVEGWTGDGTDAGRPSK